MWDDEAGPTAKKFALVLELREPKVICRRLTEAGWRYQEVRSTDELESCNPDMIGCLLVDSADKQLADKILAWCVESPRWLQVPKLLIGFDKTEHTALMHASLTAIERHLPSYLKAAQAMSKKFGVDDANDRRQNYRHPCNWPVNIEVFEEASLQDLSTRGAALELPFDLPEGTRLRIPITDTELLLKMLEAEVISSNASGGGNFCVHVSFMRVSAQVERALQRYLLTLQTRREPA